MATLDIANQIISDTVVPDASVYFASRNIGSIVADITLRKIQTDEDTITTHPTEPGRRYRTMFSSILKSLKFKLGFRITWEAMPAMSQDILALKATRQIFDVSIGKRFYTSMLFGNMTVLTDETSEYALIFTARLQQIIMSNTSDSGVSQSNQSDNSASSRAPR